MGSRHAVAVTSGTTALYLALKAAGVGPGDEVIVPDVTFVATPNAVRAAGAAPILVDIQPETLTLDPEAVRQALSPRTKAIIPVHVTGRGGTIREILALAEKRGLVVIEDAAEALGGKCGGRSLGTLGRFGCFSFSPNKTLSTGQGGIVVTDDDEAAKRLRAIKDQGRTGPGTGGDDHHPHWGFNLKFTNLQAAVGLVQLHRLEGRLARQRRIHSLYREGLASLKSVRVFPFDLENGETPQWTDIEADGRDQLDAFLRGKGIHCRKFWFPIHRQPPYAAEDARFPAATRLLPRCLWLPSAFQMTDDDAVRVVKAVSDCYRR